MRWNKYGLYAIYIDTLCSTVYTSDRSIHDKDAYIIYEYSILYIFVCYALLLIHIYTNIYKHTQNLLGAIQAEEYNYEEGFMVARRGRKIGKMHI